MNGQCRLERSHRHPPGIEYHPAATRTPSQGPEKIILTPFVVRTEVENQAMTDLQVYSPEYENLFLQLHRQVRFSHLRGRE